MSNYDLIIRDVLLVRPNVDDTPSVDIAVTDGKITEVGGGLDTSSAATVVDGDGKLAFPTDTESKAWAQGGVTTADGIGGKVNPPLRPREDVEALWSHLLAGDIDWVVSDHACCKEATKFGDDHEDVFAAKSGFGGTEYLLPGLEPENSESAQEYSPLRGLDIGSTVTHTVLRGQQIYADGVVTGAPRGQYLRRPTRG